MSSNTIPSDKMKSSIMIDRGIWKEVRLQSIREDKEIGELLADLFRERYLEKPQQRRIDNKDLKLIGSIKLLAEKYKVNESDIIENIESLYKIKDIITKDPKLEETINYISKKYKVSKLLASTYIQIQMYMSATHKEQIKQQIEAGR